MQGRPPTAPPRPPTAPPQYQPVPPPRPPVTPAPAAPKRSRRKMLVIAGIAIVAFEALVLVATLWYYGRFEDTVLNVRQAEAGVQQILSDPINGYGANDVESVTCNNGEDPTVERGKGFTCQVTINGAQREVQVLFSDDAGTYEVDGPR